MFTDDEKAQIRLYLGYPDVYLDANSRLENAMNVVGLDRPEVVTIVQGLLTQLAAVDTALGKVLSTAGLKRAEDIEWYQSSQGGGELDVKRKEGRRLASRLSVIFGMPIENDVFGDQGFGGYGFTSRGNQYGGPIPLG